MTSYKTLRERLDGHLAASKAITDRAEDEGNRDFTPAEQTAIQGHIDAGRELLPQVKMARADEQMTAKLRALGPDVPGGLTSGSGGYGGGTGYVAGASSWAQRVAGKLSKAAATHGVKSISTGGIDVPSVLEPTVVLPSRPNRLLELVPTRPLVGNAYSYPKQTARTSNAATVADGATKPTSVYTFEEVEDRARVVAHLSEPIPLRYFEDHSDLEGILDSQMRDDLLLKVEALIATGSGVGEDWTGILATSGVLAQTWTTDLVTTLRKARTALEVLGEIPTAWVFNAVDIERLDLLTDDNARYYGTELANLLGNLPRVASSAVTVGTALLGDFRQSRLFVRQDATLDVDRSGDLFAKNQARLRMECRMGFGVLRAQSFVAVGLTA